jgi:hypothetical protein
MFVGAKSVTSSGCARQPVPPEGLVVPAARVHQGIGYMAYGYVTIPRSVFLNATRMKVIVSRSNSSARLPCRG